MIRLLCAAWMCALITPRALLHFHAGLLALSGTGACATTALDLSGSIRSDQDAHALAAGLGGARISALSSLTVTGAGRHVGSAGARALLRAVAGSVSLRRFVWCGAAGGAARVMCLRVPTARLARSETTTGTKTDAVRSLVFGPAALLVLVTEGLAADAAPP